MKVYERSRLFRASSSDSSSRASVYFFQFSDGSKINSASRFLALNSASVGWGLPSFGFIIPPAAASASFRSFAFAAWSCLALTASAFLALSASSLAEPVSTSCRFTPIDVGAVGRAGGWGVRREVAERFSLLLSSSASASFSALSGASAKRTLGNFGHCGTF